MSKKPLTIKWCNATLVNNADKKATAEMLVSHLAKRALVSGQLTIDSRKFVHGSKKDGINIGTVEKYGLCMTVQASGPKTRMSVVVRHNKLSPLRLKEVFEQKPVEKKAQPQKPPVVTLVTKEILPNTNEQKEVDMETPDEPAQINFRNDEDKIEQLLVFIGANPGVHAREIRKEIMDIWKEMQPHQAGACIGFLTRRKLVTKVASGPNRDTYSLSTLGQSKITTKKEALMNKSNNGVHTPTVGVTNPHPELTDEEIIEIFRARFNTTELENKLVAADSNVDAAKGMWEEAIAERDRIAEQLEAAKAARAKLLENL